METTIKCNMANGQYEILERDQVFYHFRGEKRLINPADATRPIIRFRIFPVRHVDYEKYFGPKLSEAVRIEYMKTMGYSSLEMIHNPNLNKVTLKPSVKDKSEQLESKRDQLRHAIKSHRPLDGPKMELIERLKSEVAELEK